MRGPRRIGDRPIRDLPQQQRQEGPADGVDHADDQRAEERAADRADAADHDHHQHHDQDMVAHAGLDREDRRRHQPGEAGKRCAHSEQDGVEQADIDAEHRHHSRVAGAGADQHADARMVDQ